MTTYPCSQPVSVITQGPVPTESFPMSSFSPINDTQSYDSQVDDAALFQSLCEY